MSKKSKFRFESVLGLRRSKEEDSKQRLRRARAVESTAAESAQWLSAALVVAERRMARNSKADARGAGAWRMIAAMRENARRAGSPGRAGPPDGGGQDQPGAGHEESASRPAGEGPFDAGTGCRRSVGRGTRGGGASRDVFPRSAGMERGRGNIVTSLAGHDEAARTAGEPVTIRIELGCARLGIDDLSAIDVGSVIELDSAAADEVDVFLNDQPLAAGRVVGVPNDSGQEMVAVEITQVRDHKDHKGHKEHEEKQEARGMFAAGLLLAVALTVFSTTATAGDRHAAERPQYAACREIRDRHAAGREPRRGRLGEHADAPNGVGTGAGGGPDLWLPFGA